MLSTTIVVVSLEYQSVLLRSEGIVDPSRTAENVIGVGRVVLVGVVAIGLLGPESGSRSEVVAIMAGDQGSAGNESLIQAGQIRGLVLGGIAVRGYVAPRISQTPRVAVDIVGSSRSEPPCWGS